jgi:Asp-tRNA(Asn)/Glu-tRNA(Gln) amidotransferase A subunit family amidase
LTNKVVEKILHLTDGLILDEDEEQVSNLPVFDDKRISEAEIHDCETIQLLSKEHEDIAIYGPIRKVHFGKRLHEDFKNLKGEKLRNKMFDIILSVNYQIPDFEYGNIMQIGNNKDDKKIMKLLTNKTDYIIDKYDYILLNTSDEKPIMITNNILNKMLPSNWTLVDEFTVVAPMTSESEWEKLLKSAKQYDQFDTFKS